MLKQTFLNNFLQEVAKNLGYDGTIEGKNILWKQKKALDIDINFQENKKSYMSPIYSFANINDIILKANKNVERSVKETLMKQFNRPY